MRSRLRLCAALIASAALAPPADAKKPPLLEDPKGDHPVAAGDIVSADLATVRTGKGRLVITLTTAAPPSPNTPYSYDVSFTVDECEFTAIWFGHPFAGVFENSAVGCDDSDSSTPLAVGNATVKGSTITWVVSLGRDFKIGALVTDVTAGSEPGGMSSGSPLSAAGDAAATDKTYKIGS